MLRLAAKGAEGHYGDCHQCSDGFMRFRFHVKQRCRERWMAIGQ
jgi:hypothetical protein